MDQESTETSGTPVRRRDRFWAGVFVVFWLVPLTWAGLTYTPFPFVPAYVADLASISSLFPYRARVWEVVYLEGRRRGESDWIELPREEYFPSTPFGYMRRIDFLILKDHRRFFPPKARPGEIVVPRMELSLWLARRHSILHPDAPAIDAVRYVRSSYVVGRDLNHPQGRWMEEPLASISPTRLNVVARDEVGDFLRRSARDGT